MHLWLTFANHFFRYEVPPILQGGQGLQAQNILFNTSNTHSAEAQLRSFNKRFNFISYQSIMPVPFPDAFQPHSALITGGESLAQQINHI